MSLPRLLETYFPFPGWFNSQPRPQPTLDDFPVHTTEKLRFADTDRNGHVSNAVFAVCCQNARMELLHDKSRVPLSIDAQFVVARLMLEFLREMHWPGTVEIGTRIDYVGSSSVTMAQSLFLEGSRVASATSTVVLMDRSTRRATPFPHETATALRALASGAHHLKPRHNGAAIAVIKGTSKE
ncbi:MAG: acyl-CoA thioesterase [Hyphomonadaceae bacterium]|nr:acyl-CoA thioesterase [Hyphomonadaceae bacterium]